MQEMVTGLTRDTIPFTTVLTPDPRNTDLPTTDFIPVYHYGHGRKLLDAAGASALLASAHCAACLAGCACSHTARRHSAASAAKLMVTTYEAYALVSAGRVQQPADATALPHSRGLKQRYAYDARGRLQYAPQNGAIGSFDFQFAFNTAIANLSATGLVLTPGSYQVSLACWSFSGSTPPCCSCSTCRWCTACQWSCTANTWSGMQFKHHLLSRQT